MLNVTAQIKCELYKKINYWFHLPSLTIDFGYYLQIKIASAENLLKLKPRYLN